MEAEDSRKSVEELPVIFAAANFPTGVETETKIIDNDEDDDLDIGISFLPPNFLASRVYCIP